MSLPISGPELDRLAALGAYGILDNEGVDLFDRYVRLAATLIGTSMATISFVDEDQVWFKSAVGVTGDYSTRCGTFCTLVVQDGRPLAISDASLDPRFADSPSVCGVPGIRFYLGAPLQTQNGERIGAISAFDSKPRPVGAEMVARLVDLAEAVVTTLELYKTMREVKSLALSDALTGLPNRIRLYQALNGAIATALHYQQPFSILYIDCDKFKLLNDKMGHLTGDRMLQALAVSLRGCLWAGELAARLGGDEFAVILPGAGSAAALLVAHRIQACCAEMMLTGGWPITLSIGVATFLMPPDNVDAALAVADEAMYRAKRGGRNRICSVAVGNHAEAAVVPARYPAPLP
jgi:diguanylate cyclase (GGDEF)-like protein